MVVLRNRNAREYLIKKLIRISSSNFCGVFRDVCEQYIARLIFFLGERLLSLYFSSQESSDQSELLIGDVTCKRRYPINGPRSIYRYSNMAPRFSRQNCKFLKFLSSLNSQNRLE